MDHQLTDLLSAAGLAALREAQSQMAIIKAQIAILCEMYNVRQDKLGVADLPDNVRVIADRLIGEYRKWSLASFNAQRMIADLRKDE